jgi:hypothetical protein
VCSSDVRCQRIICDANGFLKNKRRQVGASKDSKVIAATGKLPELVKKVEARQDKSEIRFDLVPRQSFFAANQREPLL